MRVCKNDASVQERCADTLTQCRGGRSAKAAAGGEASRSSLPSLSGLAKEEPRSRRNFQIERAAEGDLLLEDIAQRFPKVRPVQHIRSSGSGPLPPRVTIVRDGRRGLPFGYLRSSFSILSNI